MDISFANLSLQELVQSTVRSDAHFGPQDGALLRQRLCELLAANSLAIAASVPTLGMKKLGSRNGGFGVRVRSRLRLVFEVADSNAPRVGGDGNVDLAKVGAIRILAVEECDEP
ncbi:MAG: hypothetical protein AB7F89_10260 [Pirellulaceae bacterium]